jgi:hypothetical protein
VGVALGWLVDAVVARAVGPLVGAAADVDADGWAPAGVVGVGVGPAAVGAVGVDSAVGVHGAVGIAVGDAVADGVGAESRRTGDGTGRGRVVAPAGPTGAIG